MASATGPGGQEAQSLCGFCGYSDGQRFTFCPRCGQPAGAFSGQLGNEPTRTSAGFGGNAGEQFGAMPTDAATGAYGMGEALTQPGTSPYTGGSVPTQPGTSPYMSGSIPTQPGTHASQPLPGAGLYGSPGWQQGAVGYPQSGAYGAGQVATAAPPKRRGRRVGVIAGVLLAVLLVGSVGAYVAYTAFFAYSPTDSARYLPANTLVYTSFDLQQVSQNTHNVSQQDVAGATNTSGFEQATGLDFQKDVAPWIKRGFSFALVDITSKPSSSGFGNQTTPGTVFLISTHDTSASKATLQKIVSTQEQKYGVKFTTITYQGTTLQSDVDSAQGQQDDFSNPTNKAAPLVLGMVKDQVIIASTVAVAEQVVDRANGHGDTLAQDGTFTRVMGKLPDGRFGTLYANISQLVRGLLTGSSQTGFDSYPVGYGAMQFTDAGMRVTFTLEAKAGTQKTYDLKGDTNASAGVVPASTILFAGLGNLHGVYQQAKDTSGGLLTDQGFLDALGLSPNDALFNAPVSVALLTPEAGSDDVVEPLVMLHSSLDAAAINAKVQQATEKLGYESSNSTVDGVPVTKVQDEGTTVYYTVLGHDLVFGYDTDGLTQAIDASKGTMPTLAGSSTFKKLVGAAPQKNAVTLFVSLENLAKAPGELGQTYREIVGQTGLLTKVTASYLTYNTDASGLTFTEDIALK
jgi:hypothetical protein